MLNRRNHVPHITIVRRFCIPQVKHLGRYNFYSVAVFHETHQTVVHGIAAISKTHAGITVYLGGTSQQGNRHQDVAPQLVLRNFQIVRPIVFVAIEKTFFFHGILSDNAVYRQYPVFRECRTLSFFASHKKQNTYNEQYSSHLKSLLYFLQTANPYCNSQ